MSSNLAPSRLSRQPAAFAAGFIPSVRAIAEGMLEVEGPYHVQGSYIPCATDAARARQREAEILHGAAVRGHLGCIAECRRLTSRAALATLCPWCNGAIRGDEPVIATGGRLLHEGCGAALDVILAADVRREG